MKRIKVIFKFDLDLDLYHNQQNIIFFPFKLFKSLMLLCSNEFIFDRIKQIGQSHIESDIENL